MSNETLTAVDTDPQSIEGGGSGAAEEIVVCPYPVIVPDEQFQGAVYKAKTFRKDTEFEGFWFYIKEYETVDAIRNQLKSVATEANFNPDDVIVYLFNNALAALMRTKVTAGDLLPKAPSKRAQLLEKGDNLVISVDDAKRFVPGKTEAYSLSGVNKRIKELMSLRDEQLELPEAERDQVKLEAIKAEGKAMLTKRNELIAKQNEMEVGAFE